MKSNRRKSSYGQKELARRNVFYHRLEIICDKMVGPGYFELLTESSLRLLYLHRYPQVEIIRIGNRVMTDEEFLEYKTTLAELLSEHFVDTLTGQKISYARFLTDAMVLLHYVQYRIGSRIRGFARLFEAFTPYFTTTDWFEKERIKIVEIMSLNDLRLYDFYRGTVRITIERMSTEKFGGTNEIFVHRLTHSTCLQDVDGIKRTIVQLGVPSAEKVDRFDWIYLKQADLGFKDVQHDIPLPLYEQQHALDRFEQRVIFCRGYVQAFLGYIFKENKAKTIVRNGYVLVECYLGNHKVGYFVISLHRDKWLVRTFLFLTNEGTPEGNKLRKLTKLEILDKKFLMLDRMDAFLTYNIAGDKVLRKLFEKAGCGSILKYAEELLKFGESPLKSPDFIHRYLSKLG